MQKQRQGQYLNVTKIRKDKTMPMGKGTYGTTKGRPPAKKKSMLTAKQKTLPASLQKKIMKKKK